MVTNASGIDVSHYQKRIDWVKVKNAGVSYAIIKATEGDNFVDPRFDYNWTRTRRLDILRGAYHFFRPKVDPEAQAKLYLRIAGQTLRSMDLPPVVDIEASPDFVRQEWSLLKVEERVRRVGVWLEAVEAETGRKPMIYTGFYSWFDYLGNTDQFVEYPLWIAAYNVQTPRIPANNWGGRGWTVWQTTGKGVVPGIRDEMACVDLNLFRSNLHDLYNWVGYQERADLPPEVTNGDMMAALIDTADALKISSDEVVARTELKYLVDPVSNSLRPYDGPAVAELDLEEDEQKKLSELLETYVGKNSSVYRITHQDLINAFYYAATLEDTGGWKLITKAGLTYLTNDRDALYEGPVIENLPGLTQAQKEAVIAALGIYETEEPEVELPVEEVPEPEPEPEPQPGEESPVDETPDVEVPTEPEEEIPVEEPVPPTYGKGTNNQDVINAFYLTAIKLDDNGREMIEAAGLSGLVEDRLSVYAGPRIEELPGLTNAQRISIADLLEVDLGDWTPIEEVVAPIESEPVDTPDEEVGVPVDSVPTEDDEAPTETCPTYPGLVNQDLINLFYKAAALLGENGWQWIINAGLKYIGDSRAARFLEYDGPDLTELAGLSADQKSVLQHELSQYK